MLTEIFAESSDHEMNLFVAVVILTITAGLFVWALAQIKNFILWVKWVYDELFVVYPQKERDKKFLHQVYKIGPLFAYNEEASITAIAFRKRLLESVAEKNKILTKESADDLGKLAKPVRVTVYPTYTFAKGEDGYVMLTGELRDLDRVIERFIERKTGYLREQISDPVWNKARSILAVRDKRLVVPMVREGQLPNGDFLPPMKVQVEIWGQYNLDDLKEELSLC